MGVAGIGLPYLGWSGALAADALKAWEWTNVVILFEDSQRVCLLGFRELGCGWHIVLVEKREGVALRLRLL